MDRGGCVRFDLVFQKAEPHLQVLQVNLTTVFTLCRDVGAHMLGQGPNAAGRRGSIINVASLLSFQWVFSTILSPCSNKIEGSEINLFNLGVRKNVSDTFELKRGNANYQK